MSTPGYPEMEEIGAVLKLRNFQERQHSSRNISTATQHHFTHTIMRPYFFPPSLLRLAAAPLLLVATGAVAAEETQADDAAALAKKLNNPVASLISLPFESNYDSGGGPDGDGSRYILNFQPVIPFTLNDEWNLISRTIVPYIDQHDMIGDTNQSGLGDTVQSLFLSPKDPTPGGWIWGVGPALLLPTATDDLLGTEKFSIGPTAVVINQHKGWTSGLLVNQLWSVAGDSNRDDYNATYLQPFAIYTTKKQTSYMLSSETTYDWKNNEATVPLIGTISQLVNIGGLPVQFGVAGRYYANAPDNAPDWGVRFTLTFLLPK